MGFNLKQKNSIYKYRNLYIRGIWGYFLIGRELVLHMSSAGSSPAISIHFLIFSPNRAGDQGQEKDEIHKKDSLFIAR
jgi:hypothetical protein